MAFAKLILCKSLIDKLFSCKSVGLIIVESKTAVLTLNNTVNNALNKYILAAVCSNFLIILGKLRSRQAQVKT